MREGKCQKIDAVDLAANSQEVGEEKIRANTEEEMIKELKKNSQNRRPLLFKLKRSIKYPVKMNRKELTLLNTSVKFQNIKDEENILKTSRERERERTHLQRKV